jgi:hypothetical protein
MMTADGPRGRGYNEIAGRLPPSAFHLRLRDHFGRRPAALPTSEPLPINANVRLRSTFETNRHQLTASAPDLAAARRFRAARSSIAFRLCYAFPFFPLLFFRHIDSFRELAIFHCERTAIA